MLSEAVVERAPPSRLLRFGLREPSVLLCSATGSQSTNRRTNGLASSQVPPARLAPDISLLGSHFISDNLLLSKLIGCLGLLLRALRLEPQEPPSAAAARLQSSAFCRDCIQRSRGVRPHFQPPAALLFLASLLAFFSALFLFPLHMAQTRY